MDLSDERCVVDYANAVVGIIIFFVQCLKERIVLAGNGNIWEEFVVSKDKAAVVGNDEFWFFKIVEEFLLFLCHDNFSITKSRNTRESRPH